MPTIFTIPTRRLTMAALSIAAIVALVVGINLSGVGPAQSDQGATLQSSAVTPTKEQILVFDSTVSSIGTTLNTLPGGITYGWNHLEGKTRWGKRSAKVDFLGDVDYTNGSGPFSGYVTVIRSDGTRIAFSVTGWAVAPQDAGTNDATFTGILEVIGGSKNFQGVQGTGTMRGNRSADLGGAVSLRFSLALQR